MKLGKFFTESGNFSETRGNSETVGKCIIASEAVVDWPAGTPGKIPVGRAAEAGNIWAARVASTLNNLANVVENIL